MTEDEAAGRTMQASAKKLWPPSRGLGQAWLGSGWLGLAGALARRLAAATKGALISPANVKNCGYADDQTAISVVVFVASPAAVVLVIVVAVEKCKFHFCFAFSHCFYSRSTIFS